MISVPGRRGVLAAVILVVGCLQAWASGVIGASPVVWILAAAAILVPAAAALVTDSRAAIFVAIPVSLVLLFAAQMISAQPLRFLLVFSLAAAGLLGGNEYLERLEAKEGSGGPAPR